VIRGIFPNIKSLLLGPWHQKLLGKPLLLTECHITQYFVPIADVQYDVRVVLKKGPTTGAGCNKEGTAGPFRVEIKRFLTKDRTKKCQFTYEWVNFQFEFYHEMYQLITRSVSLHVVDEPLYPSEFLVTKRLHPLISRII